MLAPDVLDHLDLLDGAVRAQRARVRLLARVGQHVPLEVAALREHPLAPGAHALSLGRARGGEGGRRGRGGRGGGGALEGAPLRAAAAAEVDQERVQVSSIGSRARIPVAGCRSGAPRQLGEGGSAREPVGPRRVGLAGRSAEGGERARFLVPAEITGWAEEGLKQNRRGGVV